MLWCLVGLALYCDASSLRLPKRTKLQSAAASPSFALQKYLSGPTATQQLRQRAINNGVANLIHRFFDDEDIVLFVIRRIRESCSFFNTSVCSMLNDHSDEYLTRELWRYLRKGLECVVNSFRQGNWLDYKLQLSAVPQIESCAEIVCVARALQTYTGYIQDKKRPHMKYAPRLLRNSSVEEYQVWLLPVDGVVHVPLAQIGNVIGGVFRPHARAGEVITQLSLDVFLIEGTGATYLLDVATGTEARIMPQIASGTNTIHICIPTLMLMGTYSTYPMDAQLTILRASANYTLVIDIGDHELAGYLHSDKLKMVFFAIWSLTSGMEIFYITADVPDNDPTIMNRRVVRYADDDLTIGFYGTRYLMTPEEEQMASRLEDEVAFSADGVFVRINGDSPQQWLIETDSCSSRKLVMVPETKLFVVTDTTDTLIKRSVIERLDFIDLPGADENQRRLKGIWRKLIEAETEAEGWEELKMEFETTFCAEDVFDLYRGVYDLGNF